MAREAITAGFRWAFRLDAALAGPFVAVFFAGGRLHRRSTPARAP